MRLLVDTHALLWWLTDDPRLSYAAEAAISDPDNEVFVSACIGYEIAYKQRLGRLPPLPESLSRRLERQGIATMPVFRHDEGVLNQGRTAIRGTGS